MFLDTVPAESDTDLLSIDIAIGQGHGWVVLIHRITRQGADEVGLGTVSKWERFGQSIERLGAHRALCIVLLLLVALSGRGTLSRATPQS